ncbi:glycoside hydrolase/deacetylase [Violaceomyces palustris]|uniref:Glycoside hydrolase/deacetylase n=1 Tax=Violaceomyces palustris TaxID=1673888 RepID=A0ACD0P0Z2_9BASI|nr:glycoside hydrolase/deacetylase [Violaceomyces palustris]
MKLFHLAAGTMALAATPVLVSAQSPNAAPIPRDGLVQRSAHPAGHLFSNRSVHSKVRASRLRRQSSNTSKNGMPYPEAGSNPPGESTLPQIWIDRYNEKKKAGLIPDIPPSNLDPNGGVMYPEGTDMTDVCSWTVQKCDTGDIWLAPDGYVGITFDDGPTPQTPELVEYLNEQKQGATHFLIGSAIVWNAEIMDYYTKADPPMHLGVHTWSHTLQTSKTDLEVLGDLGWTMQIIYDYTGKVPMYFRPPEGDVDARVRAIAKEVLGLQTVMWNKDADDWCLRQGNGTAQLETCLTGVGKSKKSVVHEMRSWAQDTSGKGFISLEHETTDQAIDAFKKYHKSLASKDWKVVNVPDLQGLPYYQNQYTATSEVEEVDSILPTREPIDIDHSDAQIGSSKAPDVSAFADLPGSGVKASTSSSTLPRSSSTSSSTSATTKGSGSSISTTSSSSSTTASAQSSTSGASTSRAVTLLPLAIVALTVAFAVL